MLRVKDIVFGEGRPKLLVPLTASTQEELVHQARIAVQSAADVIEWRMDFYEDLLEKAALLDTLRLIRMEIHEKVLLATLRTTEAGGLHESSLHTYRELCMTVAQSGAIDLIDLELHQVEFLGRQFVQTIKEHQVAIIMSSYDLRQTPADGQLVFQIGMMNQFGADMGRLVAMPQQLSDVLRMMGIVQRTRGMNHLPLAILSLGDLGKVTRVSGELIGSVFITASIDLLLEQQAFSITEMAIFNQAFAIKEEKE